MGLTILTLIARTDVSQIRWSIGILGGYIWTCRHLPMVEK